VFNENKDSHNQAQKDYWRRAGEIPEFTGISSPYEKPENPEIIVDTDKDSVEKCAEKIIDHLKKEGVLNRKI